MNSIIEQMLARYTTTHKTETINALKEIVQELALVGLYRSKFFEHAAFYGGTALRILYGLPRFSEDLDFTLFKPNPKFQLESYFSSIKTELASFGLEVSIETVKKNTESTIISAFVKANTKIHLLNIKSLSQFAEETVMNEKIQIKFEVDIDPAINFNAETKFLVHPVNAPIVTLKEPDLFAGKVHALLYRKWKHRVKGRDFYDFTWYLSRKGMLRGEYFLEKAQQSASLPDHFILTEDSLKKLLFERFESIDFESAKNDVRPFIKDSRELEFWSRDYFNQITERLKLV